MHKEGPYSDNLAVAWQIPTNDPSITIITAPYLSAFLPAVTSNIARAGVEESLVSQVRLYPNPFDSKFTLGISQPGKLYISFIDNLGRVVHQTTFDSAGTETTLDLTHLKQGVYIVKVSAQNGITQVFKVIKK